MQDPCFPQIFHYFSDISVFFGARSNKGQTSWIWENETMVNDPTYPTSNQTVCQQMSLPLTYDDGINLFPKRCNQEKAYFACDLPCKLGDVLLAKLIMQNVKIYECKKHIKVIKVTISKTAVFFSNVVKTVWKYVLNKS